jgi:hypothetical protein
MPVLNHNAVANVVPNGHPDVFNASVVAQLQSALAIQLANNVTNPYIVGWSVGNEGTEDIQTAAVQTMLGLGASVPAKQKLVNEAVYGLYAGI